MEMNYDIELYLGYEENWRYLEYEEKTEEVEIEG